VTSRARLRWLLPDALYRAGGLAQTVQDPAIAQPRQLAPHWPVLDGPASRALDAWLRPLLPDGLVRCRREDYGTPPATAATVRYRSPKGGHVSVLRRRLTCPLLLDAFCDPNQRAVVRIRPTGTEVIRTDDNGEHRLMMVRPDGTLLIVVAIGLPAAGIKAPIPSEQLDHLELLLDSPSRDVDIDEAADTLP
jgi:hypothetical protein